MKYTPFSIVLIVIVILISCVNKVKPVHSTTGPAYGLIFPKGERILNDNFKGAAYLYPMVSADSLNPSDIGNVTFDPGARTRWHIHPAGQILLAIEGTGYYQEKGKVRTLFRKGDVIRCPPDVPHWHGASVDSGFVQIAITGRQKGPTIWLEHVTDEEYHSSEK